ncbi:MAG TPA: hypothetical protein VJN92_10210 [Candidatus Acidoferrum sp.]|nr:hypothetical protein [Candidatus Acidoferrum sp.]
MAWRFNGAALLDAGTISFRSSLGVVLGANIGATSTVHGGGEGGTDGLQQHRKGDALTHVSGLDPEKIGGS